MELTKILLTNYLPYAKGTIIGRAIPAIDGLKPVQRRILYVMYKMGLLKGNRTKSNNIIGQTMKFHPHGDMAIYDTLVRMTTGNESLNAPYIDSKGNFGKVYSKEIEPAAPRYTEAKLTGICSEIFDGIEEGAVDFINNFDDTMLEPVLLPVKFPNILVNTSAGIAVGTSSNIPSFNLKNVCESTIGIIKGTIKNGEDLAEVLGVPEFTTGGHIHTNKAELVELMNTGKQSLVMSGSVTTYPNRIVINEIPYRATAESIISAVEKYVKSGELKGISNINDDIDLNGFKLVVELKRGYDSSDVLKKLRRYTNLRMSMNFITRVIIDDRCEELGIFNLIEEWIKFRVTTVGKIYKFRYNKACEQEHLLNAWEKIKDDIKKITVLIANSNEEDLRKSLVDNYGLDDKQIDYILNMKIKMLTQNNLEAKIKELKAVREDIKVYDKIVKDDKYKKDIIVGELETIKNKYGTRCRTQMAEPIVETNDEDEEVEIDDTLVRVIVTKSGYIKRLATLRDIEGFSLPSKEEVKHQWDIRNNEHILVFTYDGTVHKILVDSIDASRGGLKDKVADIIGVYDDKQILFMDKAGDYSGRFNLVYPNGRGVIVKYERAKGNRSKYVSLFKAHEPGNLWFTTSDKFFMITARRKAAYCDLSIGRINPNRVAFKVARIDYNDRIFGLQPVENVPDISKIDLSKYKKDYCMSIRKDVLWHGAEGDTDKESVDSGNDTDIDGSDVAVDVEGSGTNVDRSGVVNEADSE